MTKYVLTTISALIVVSLPVAAQMAPPATDNSAMSQFPLIQVMKLKGDQYSGFTKSCLVVYDNGRYHREFHRQENTGGRPQPGWRPIEVFENVLPDSDLQNLKAILQSPDFVLLHGNVGKYQNIWPQLAWSRSGDAMPHGDIDLFVTAVRRAQGAQVFETFVETMPHDPQSHLTQFVALVDKISKDNSGRQEHGTANNCSAGEVPSTSAEMESSRPIRHLNTPGPITGFRNASVKLDLMVYPDGTTGEIKVTDGIDPQMDIRAVEALHKWTFAPAVLVGIPVSVLIHLQIDFRPH
jgi:TonB-like protein